MSEDYTTDYDVIIVGSGAGGLTAAVTSQLEGMSTLVIEKTEQFGGSTSKSGGTIWIPNTLHLKNAGVKDSYEQGKKYLDATIGDRSPDSLKNAYLNKGPEMVTYLDEHTNHVRWDYTPDYSDYYPELPGGKPEGRAIEARVFDLNILGEDLPLLRLSGLPTKGMVLNSYEFHKVNMITRTWIGKMTSLKVGMRLIRSFLTPYKPSSLGEALVARLYASLKDVGGKVWVSTSFEELIYEDGRVTGVVAKQNDKEIKISARKGVIFASGGFSHSQELREKHLPKPTNTEWTLAAEGQTGDVLEAAKELGAKTDLMEKMWGTPTSAPPNGSPFMPVAERATPGLIIVNGNGKRYTNESVPYHEFVEKMYENNSNNTETIPSWMIFDHTVKKRYLVFGIMPGVSFPDEWIDSGYTKKANTIGELAKKIEVPVDKLNKTLSRFNTFAKLGVDQDYHRGESAYDRYYGDPTLENPNLAALDQPPYYAIPIYPGDIGTKGGLVIDEYARVIKEDGVPIPGLYGTGNCTAAIMGETYPGPGATIGSAMVFGYIGAKHIKQGITETKKLKTEV